MEEADEEDTTVRRSLTLAMVGKRTEEVVLEAGKNNIKSRKKSNVLSRTDNHALFSLRCKGQVIRGQSTCGEYLSIYLSPSICLSVYLLLYIAICLCISLALLIGLPTRRQSGGARVEYREGCGAESGWSAFSWMET